MVVRFGLHKKRSTLSIGRVRLAATAFVVGNHFPRNECIRPKKKTRSLYIYYSFACPTLDDRVPIPAARWLLPIGNHFRLSMLVALLNRRFGRQKEKKEKIHRRHDDDDRAMGINRMRPVTQVPTDQTTPSKNTVPKKKREGIFYPKSQRIVINKWQTIAERKQVFPRRNKKQDCKKRLSRAKRRKEGEC